MYGYDLPFILKIHGCGLGLDFMYPRHPIVFMSRMRLRHNRASFVQLHASTGIVARNASSKTRLTKIAYYPILARSSKLFLAQRKFALSFSLAAVVHEIVKRKPTNVSNAR